MDLSSNALLLKHYNIHEFALDLLPFYLQSLLMSDWFFLKTDFDLRFGLFEFHPFNLLFHSNMKLDIQRYHNLFLHLYLILQMPSNRFYHQAKPNYLCYLVLQNFSFLWYFSRPIPQTHFVLMHLKAHLWLLFHHFCIRIFWSCARLNQQFFCQNNISHWLL